MNISRSGFYKWKNNLFHPCKKTNDFIQHLNLFSEYHEKYPSHGYRWLNAKIFFDTGIHMSDTHAHKCCKTLGIASKKRHHKFFKPRERSRIYPNLLMAGLNISDPLQYIVSDMTAFYFNKQYFELTLYMDLWNNEILAHSLSSKRGDRMTYFNGLKSILDLKANSDFYTVLHSDQGSVYTSKAYNDGLSDYNIIRSMSRAGTPTDNAAIESINGWIKDELFNDFHITGNNDITYEINEYIRFFNEERPSYALNYLTPKQYKERFSE